MARGVLALVSEVSGSNTNSPCDLEQDLSWVWEGKLAGLCVDSAWVPVPSPAPSS